MAEEADPGWRYDHALWSVTLVQSQVDQGGLPLVEHMIAHDRLAQLDESEGNMNGLPAAVAPPLVPVTAT